MQATAGARGCGRFETRLQIVLMKLEVSWEGWQGSLMSAAPCDFRIPCVGGRVSQGLGFIALMSRAALVGASFQDEWRPGRLLLAFRISRQRPSQKGGRFRLQGAWCPYAKQLPFWKARGQPLWPSV